MATQTKQQRLAQVKLALAAKYENLARVVKSKPRRATWLLQAKRHRAQANEILIRLARQK